MLLRLRFLLKRIVLRCCNVVGACIVASFVITALIVINTFSNFDPTQYSYAYEDFSNAQDEVFYRGCVDTQMYVAREEYSLMNATFVMLTRNEEINDVLKTIASIESHFNQWFKYPYVFLNDAPFTQEFKTAVMAATNSKTEFGTIDELLWDFPADIKDELLLHQTLENQGDRAILYGNMESYHKMCRFYSGLFYKHPLLQKYEWYWRLEPDVEFFCDISYDPFWEMAQKNKRYGFNVIIPEIYWTVPNLFRYTRAFICSNKVKVGSLWKVFTNNYKILDTEDSELADFVNHETDLELKLPEKVVIDDLLTGNAKDPFDIRNSINRLIERARSKKPILEDKFDDQEFNLCHFWSNFEIAKIDVFDNDLYNAYFQFLEKSGGFWKERWGDAPVHSLGLALHLNISEVHYFRDIGYRHSDLQHCPKNWNGIKDNDDDTRPGNAFLPYIEAETKYKRTRAQQRYDPGVSVGSGCRCRCPKMSDIEDNAYHCMYAWLDVVYAEDEDLSTGEYTPKVNTAEYLDRLRKEYNEYKSQ